jgi:hypothetical protein
VSEEEVVPEASMANIGTPPLQLTVEDIVGALSEIDLTPLDDEPPDDLLLIPRDSTAAISPAAQEAGFTCRVQTMADTVRPQPSVSASSDEPSPIDAADPEAMREEVDGDTPLEAPEKWSRTKAAGHNKNPWLFGHWTVKRAPLSDAPPSRDDTDADAIGQHRDTHDDYEEDTL